MTATGRTNATTSQESTFDEGGRPLNRPAGVMCPACRCELQIGELHRAQFAGCPQCAGMMFQQEVFGALIQRLRSTSTLPPLTPQPLNPDELSDRRLCPACAGNMETHAYAGPGNSVVDTCFPCGLIWFDEGELTKLVRAPGRR